MTRNILWGLLIALISAALLIATTVLGVFLGFLLSALAGLATFLLIVWIITGLVQQEIKDYKSEKKKNRDG